MSINGSSEGVKSYLVVHLIELDKPKKQVLKSKVYANNANPNFVETLTLEFVFESNPF